MIIQMLMGAAALPLGVSVSPGSASGTAASSTVTTNSVTASPVNNVGSVTYSWALVGGTLSGASGATATASTSATTAFTFTGVPNSTTGTATFRVTITDTVTGQTAQQNVLCDGTNTL